MKNYYTFALCSLLALGLIGCRSIMNPNFLPTGYSFHGEEYKAVPGNEANDIGYEYSQHKNAWVLSKWVAVADEMVQGLEERAELSPNTVYIRENNANVFNTSFEFALREAFIKRGFYVISEPGATYEVAYNASPENGAINPLHRVRYNGDQELDPLHNKPKPNENFVLTLDIIEEGKHLGSGSGVYAVPSYGYKIGRP